MTNFDWKNFWNGQCFTIVVGKKKKWNDLYFETKQIFVFFQFLRFDDLLSKNLPFDDDDDDGHLLSKRKKKAILLQNSNVIVGLQ